MAREPVKGTPVSLAELEAKGIKIVANQLSRIDELRIGITLPNGGKIVILHSASGRPQDAGIFSGVDGEWELVVVQQGGMTMWTDGEDSKPQANYYDQGEVAQIDPAYVHATHPDQDAWIVGIMSGDWSKAKKNEGEDGVKAKAFDDAVDAQLAEEVVAEETT